MYLYIYIHTMCLYEISAELLAALFFWTSSQCIPFCAYTYTYTYKYTYTYMYIFSYTYTYTHTCTYTCTYTYTRTGDPNIVSLISSVSGQRDNVVYWKTKGKIISSSNRYIYIHSRRRSDLQCGYIHTYLTYMCVLFCVGR